MRRSGLCILCVMLWTIPGCTTIKEEREGTLATGAWQAALASPGGLLRFGLELAASDSGVWSAELLNGPERIPVPEVEVSDTSVTIDLPHYDARIIATMRSQHELQGTWTKRTGDNSSSSLPFQAHFREPDPPQQKADDFAGRWRVQFSSSDDPAIGIFEVQPDERVFGTFLTTTGDYRYLAGDVHDGVLRLSCFDGAHAFLFKARKAADGQLVGDFWSRDVWHETWTATRDSNAELPNPFQLTTWNGNVRLRDLRFPDLEGTVTSLDDAKFAGKAMILQLFGSWCPNCHDAALYLAELHGKYARRGLSVVGLAFEITDDFERNAELVRRYVERHATPYPVLIAGPADKARATEAFAALDRVRSYPTTVFLDSSGTVRGIYTGFSGPATGEVHQRLRRSFEGLIEKLLSSE